MSETQTQEEINQEDIEIRELTKDELVQLIKKAKELRTENWLILILEDFKSRFGRYYNTFEIIYGDADVIEIEEIHDNHYDEYKIYAIIPKKVPTIVLEYGENEFDKEYGNFKTLHVFTGITGWKKLEL